MATRTLPRKPKNVTPWTPFQPPTRPPAGYYDPAIDAQQGAATSGLQDLQADTGTAGTRTQDDFYIAQQQQGQQRDWGLADILQARRRGTEDYATANQNLDRRYKNQADSQLQAGNQAGLAGGYQAQAARKRAENRGIDQTQLDQAQSRFQQDSATSEQRLNTGSDSVLAQLALGYQRGSEDRTTQLSRAQRENTFFGQDLADQRFYQAAGAGYVPPERPAGEGHRTVNGQRFDYRDLGNGRVALPSGETLTRAQLRARLERAKRGAA
jgi:hypothetical protein